MYIEGKYIYSILSHRKYKICFYCEFDVCRTKKLDLRKQLIREKKYIPAGKQFTIP